MNYSKEMDKAPKTQHVLLLVRSTLKGAPVVVEIGWWSAKQRRFIGDWRVDKSEPWANADPIAWAKIPAVDPEFLPNSGSGLVANLKASVKALNNKAKPAKTAPAKPKGKALVPVTGVGKAEMRKAAAKAKGVKPSNRAPAPVLQGPDDFQPMKGAA